MQQARIVQDRERFIKMPVVYFKFRKLQKSRGSGRRIASCASQIGKQFPGSLSAACPNLQSRKIPACDCSPRLFRAAHPFL